MDPSSSFLVSNNDNVVSLVLSPLSSFTGPQSFPETIQLNIDLPLPPQPTPLSNTHGIQTRLKTSALKPIAFSHCVKTTEILQTPTTNKEACKHLE